jgi:hypothetical protein
VLSEGTTFGDYRVERVIGWGGGGVVYEATQLSVGRLVALKLLRPELGEDPEFVERFKREGRVQASLEHPHVLDVYEAGESEHGLFLALRLVTGGSLANEIASGGLGGERALKELTQVAEALDAAHAAGIVHGDVKPQNVLLDKSGEAYLTDFGLTRELGRTRATASVAVLGTVAYLAPELIHGQRATPASDRYSLAAMAFECLTGERPFQRPTAAATMFAHTSEPPPAASSVRPELPVALDPVLSRGLAKNPKERQASAAELLSGCREAIPAETLTGLAAPPPPRRPAPGTPTAAPMGPGSKANGRRAWAVALVAAAVAATVAVFATLAIDDDEPASAAAEVPPPPSGSVVLGSDLKAAADRTVDCAGGEASLTSRPCSLLQAELAGATIRVPEDGVVTSWTVRDAVGDLAVQVLRDQGNKSYQIARSQYVTVPDRRPHTFDTDMIVERGDRISVELGPGASVGLADTAGATTARWFPVLRGSPSASPPSKGPGTGLDGEVLMQAHILPGEKPAAPEQVRGEAAAELPAGKVVESVPLTFSEGRKVEISIIELDRKLYVDMFEQGTRLARIAVPDTAPGGEVLDVSTYVYEDTASFGEIYFYYLNPSSGRAIERIYGVDDVGFELYV